MAPGPNRKVREMRVFHHIGVSGQASQVIKGFEALGLSLRKYVNAQSDGPLFFEIGEDDSRWTLIDGIVRAGKGEVWERVWTEFSKAELSDARFLSVSSCWTSGYPEPSNETQPVPGTRFLSYFSDAYRLESYCSTCLTGAAQMNPFRIRHAPKWGSHSLLKLNWIFDELFVKKELWRDVFRPLGVACRPVLRHKDGTVMDAIVQLLISDVVELSIGERSYKLCSDCGRKTYAPICRGYFPSPLEPVQVLAKSAQYFGVGAHPFKAILVSRELYEYLGGAAALKGAEFAPCFS